MNIPIKALTTAEEQTRMFEAATGDMSGQIKPDMIFISAGFDAHKADPLAELRVETEDFAWLTDRLVGVADTQCGGRIVSVLEGGYNLRALAASVGVHVRALMR